MFDILKGWLCSNQNYMIAILAVMIVIILYLLKGKFMSENGDKEGMNSSYDAFEVRLNEDELNSMGEEDNEERRMMGVISSGADLRQEGSVMSGLGQTIPEHSGGRYSKVYEVIGVDGYTDLDNLTNNQITAGILDTNA